jgi:hypothetical protein
MANQPEELGMAISERWYAANELIREGDRVRVLSQLNPDLPGRAWAGLADARARFARATASLERVTRKATR